MKNLSILSVFILCIACVNNTKSKVNEDGLIVDNEYPDFGLFIVDIKKLKNSHGDSLLFYSEDKRIAITDSFLLYDNKKYNLLESSNSIWKEIFRPKAFNPELDIFYIEGFNGEMYFEDGKVNFKGDKNYISFSPYQSFLKTSLVGLTEETPLLTSIDGQSKLIDKNYDEYYYEVVKFKNNWVQLRSELESSGKEVVGWAEWFDDSQKRPKMLLEIIYNIQMLIAKSEGEAYKYCCDCRRSSRKGVS